MSFILERRVITLLKMKYLVIVPDGAADRPVDALAGRTPLEAADTPNMDLLARRGICGMARTFYEGFPFDSSIANMGILGYDPRKYFTGRSPLEAANLGVGLECGDVSLRCNLVTVEDGIIRDFTADHISNPEAAELIRAVDERLGGGGIEFHPGMSYRNLLVLRSGLKPSLDFTATQPHDIVGGSVEEHRIKAKSKAAAATVALLDRLGDDALPILADHPVNRRRAAEGKNPGNSLWFWGAGRKPNIPSFKSVYGLEGSLVSAVDLLKGLGRTIGLNVLPVEGATGYLDTNYVGKADAALGSLRKGDFTYIHLESTDEAGHEGSIEHKVRAIEDIDRKVVGRVLDRIEGDYAILLMPDHATPVSVRTHTTEPIPYALYDTRRKGDGVERFSEREIAANGSRRITDAYRLMKRLTASG
jgi:2,3-bisphosphoglycerate-independent phosphoglycerate mutase